MTSARERETLGAVGDSLRLFYAFLLPQPVLDELQRIVHELEQRASPAGLVGKWVGAQQMHITARFLGARSQTELPDLGLGLKRACAGRSKVSLELLGWDHFGRRRQPQVVFGALTGELSALVEIRTRLDQQLRQLGHQLDERAFAPHITLVRPKQSNRPHAASDQLPNRSLSWQQLFDTQPVPHLAFSIDRLALMRSTLSSSGASYDIVFEQRLPAEGS